MILIQIIGLLGYLALIISFSQNNKSNLLFFRILSSILRSIHYFLLFAYTGFFIAIIELFITILLYENLKKKWKKDKLIAGIAIILFIICGYISYDGIYTVLITIVMSMSVLILIFKTPSEYRLFQLVMSSTWLFYNIINLSYGGAMMEIILIIITVTNILIIDYEKIN